MTKEEIKHVQRRIGVNDDGVWGPKSIKACEKHLRSLNLKLNIWPKASQKEYKKFYGNPGDTSRHVQINVEKYKVKYLNSTVKTITCNEKIATSLDSILCELYDSEHSWILDYYIGVFVFRPTRGAELLDIDTTNWSLHAYAAAIDFWPTVNGNKIHWPTRAKMPIEVMEVFARHGWLAAGAFWHRDAMHFQATSGW